MEDYQARTLAFSLIGGHKFVKPDVAAELWEKEGVRRCKTERCREWYRVAPNLRAEPPLKCDKCLYFGWGDVNDVAIACSASSTTVTKRVRADPDRYGAKKVKDMGTRLFSGGTAWRIPPKGIALLVQELKGWKPRPERKK